MSQQRITTISTLILIAFSSLTAFAQSDEAIAYYTARNYKKAANMFKRELKADSQNARLWNFYGLALQQSSKRKQAKKAYKKAIELEPLNSDYVVNLSFLYLKMKDWDDAERTASKAILLNPDNPNAYYSRCMARAQSSKWDKALEDCDKAIGYNPGQSSLYVLKSNILLQRFTTRRSSNRERNLENLKGSVDTLDHCVTFCVGDTDAISEMADTQRVFYRYYRERYKSVDKDENAINSTDSCESLKILYKPRPGYTQYAREQMISGTIRVMAVFRADGTIGDILVLQSIPAFDKKVIKAVRAIKFKPETCDGKPVSVVKTIVYEFSIVQYSR